MDTNILIFPLVREFIVKENIENIIQVILEYLPFNSNIQKEEELKNEFYILFVFANLLKLYEEEVNISKQKVLFDLLKSKNLPKLNRFLNTLLRKLYRSNLNVRDIYDYSLIKREVLKIFFREHLSNLDPYKIENNFKKYYNDLFKYVFNLYITQKLSVDVRLDNFMLQDTYLSTRYNLYKESIRLTQIQEMCHESTLLKQIYSNFNSLNSNIVSNELQKLYTVIVDGDNKHCNRSLILKFNSNNHKLIFIKRNYPLVYDALRAIKIEDNSKLSKKYNENFELLIKNSLNDLIFFRFKKHLSEIQSRILADALSTKIQKSIVSGKYLDPKTLKELDFNNIEFINQLSHFINYILDHIDLSKREIYV